MSVDSLLEVIRLRGLVLSNLYQFNRASDGKLVWQCNISDGEKYWEFGRGESPSEAMEAALRISATTEPRLPVPPKKTVTKNEDLF